MSLAKASASESAASLQRSKDLHPPEEGPFPLLDISSQQTLEWCRTLPPPQDSLGDDVFVCSYPKSGTTWMQHIVGSLVCRASGKAAPEGHVSKRTPFFEIDPHWSGPGELAPKIVEEHQVIGRRMFNTHLRWEMMPKHERAKYIYVVREGRDTCCSFFHHLSSQRTKAGDSFTFEGSFADFHKQWIAGEKEFGRWTDHLASWDRATEDSRVLFLSYEEMKSDLRPCVCRVAAHLKLDLNDSDIDELVPTFDFGYMKAKSNQFQPVSVAWKPGFEFLRKGQQGDYAKLYGDDELLAFSSAFWERFPVGAPSWYTASPPVKAMTSEPALKKTKTSAS